jgi:hypothetical protein
MSRFAHDAEIHAIARGLQERTLPKAQWTHAAHFAAALWMLHEHRELNASRLMPAWIRAYNEATGVNNTDTGGYHETITQASLRAARAFLEAQKTLALHEMCNRLLDSPLGSPDWPLKYWSRARLFSVEARRGWLEPDLEPLPF